MTVRVHPWFFPRCLNTWPYVRRVTAFQAEDGIRDDVESRGLGDVYKRQG
ncbi:hypothetical protein ACX3VG_12760 [Escherichia coli]